MTLARVGNTAVFATVTTFDYDTVLRVFYQIDGNRLGPVNLELYTPHPDTLEKPGVPKGKVSQMPKWESRIFAGTTREWWIYIPAQYRPENPACVMVFQDGRGYVEISGFSVRIGERSDHPAGRPVGSGTLSSPPSA